jgi:hypothetical protein
MTVLPLLLLQRTTKSRKLQRMHLKLMRHQRMLRKMHRLRKKNRQRMLHQMKELPRKKCLQLRRLQNQLPKSLQIQDLAMNQPQRNLLRLLNPWPLLRKLLLHRKQSQLSPRLLLQLRKVNLLLLRAISLRLQHQRLQLLPTGLLQRQHRLSHLLIPKQRLKSSTTRPWVNTKQRRLASKVL